MTYQTFTSGATGVLNYGYGLFGNPTPQAANGKLVIGSWTDANITLASDELTIPQGYQVQLMASFYTERASGTSGNNAFCTMRWYDETNTQYIGMRATVDSQWPVTVIPNDHNNATLAFVDTSAGAITVSCRMLSINATTTVNISSSRFSTYGSQSWLAAITAPV